MNKGTIALVGLQSRSLNNMSKWRDTFQVIGKYHAFSVLGLTHNRYNYAKILEINPQFTSTLTNEL